MSVTESPEMAEQVWWVSKYKHKGIVSQSLIITIYIAENSVLILSWIHWISVVREAIDNRYQEKTSSKQKPEGLSGEGDNFSTFKNKQRISIFVFL